METTINNEPFIALMKEVGAIAKAHKGYGYNFRGIDDILNTLQPALTKTGFTLNTKIEDYFRELVQTDESNKSKYRIHTSLKMTVIFVAPDGQERSAQAIGEGVDSNGDKSSYKAQSGAFKNACFMGLCIPIEGMMEENDDGEDNSDKITPEQALQIGALFEKLPDSDQKKFLSWAKVEKLEQLPSGEFEAKVKALEAKIAR